MVKVTRSHGICDDNFKAGDLNIDYPNTLAL